MVRHRRPTAARGSTSSSPGSATPSTSPSITRRSPGPTEPPPWPRPPGRTPSTRSTPADSTPAARERIIHARQLHDLQGEQPGTSPAEAARRHPVPAAAALYVVDGIFLDRLVAYARAGGHLVLGPRTGYADHEARDTCVGTVPGRDLARALAQRLTPETVSGWSDLPPTVTATRAPRRLRDSAFT
ncbi:beta-galactosidase trimerization domain-containing protein [Streptomyces fuscichromogenes]|uniref:beta-galactosidase trimerization domain-containing protein n=1 Tax=Streptomyces fuscichromogenes TaxID=1324013 RepID=UPI00357139F3